MKFNKINKLMVIVAIVISIIFGFSQITYAKGSVGSSHSSSISSHSASSGIKSGSFSSPKSSSSAKVSSSSSKVTTKPNTKSTISSAKSSSFSNSTKNTTVINNSYYYSPNATYRNSYGVIYHSSFWDNYWFYRAIMYHNIVIVVNNGVEQQVDYGYSGLYKDIATLVIVIIIVVGIIVVIRRRRR